MLWSVKRCVVTPIGFQHAHEDGSLGSFFTSARVIYVAAKEGYLPPMFGKLHKTRGTPLNATLLQAAITILFIIFGGGFRSLINFAVVASWA